MKIIFFLIVLFWLIKPAYPGEIFFYVASSMSKPATELTEKFNKENSNLKAILITGGSGQLLNKILISKKADIFIPASEFFLNKANNKNLIIKTKDLLYQTPVFGLSKKTEKIVNNFNDIINKKLRIALGKPETMALGQIYLEIEKKMPLDIRNKIRNNKKIEAVNVSQIVNYLKREIINAGILFDSTAKANELKYIEIPKNFNKIVKVKAAILKTCKNKKDSEKFLNYIFKNKDIFKKYGFKTF